jgi:GYF domain 2
MDRWYVARGKVKKGPFSIAQLHSLAGRGVLRSTDMLLSQGAQKWVEAREVAGLFAAAPKGAGQTIAAEPPKEAPQPVPRPPTRPVHKPWLWFSAGSLGVCILVLIPVLIFGGRSNPTTPVQPVARNDGKPTPSVPSAAPQLPPPAEPSGAPNQEKIPPKGPQAAKPEEIDLVLSFLSDPYQLNGREVSSGKPPAAFARLLKTNDRNIRALADDALELAQRRAIARTAYTAWERAAVDPKTASRSLLGPILRDLARPESEDNGQKFLEDVLNTLGQSPPADAKYASLGDLVIQMEKVQSASLPPVLRQRFPAASAQGGAVSARLPEVRYVNPREMVFVNKGTKALHNVVVWFYFDVPPTRGVTPEDMIDLRADCLKGGKKLLGGAYQDRALAERVFGLGGRGIVFVPVVKPNDDLRIRYDVDAMLYCTRGWFSLDSDELKVVEQEIEGINRLQDIILRFAEPKPDPQPGQPANPQSGQPANPQPVPSGTSEKKEPTLKPGSSDLLVKGSVWQGALHQWLPNVQPVMGMSLVVTEREGNTYKGELLLNGKRLRLVVGTVEAGVIEWHGAPGQPRPGHLNKGAINGGKLEVFVNGESGGQRLAAATLLEVVRPDKR